MEATREQLVERMQPVRQGQTVVGDLLIMLFEDLPCKDPEDLAVQRAFEYADTMGGVATTLGPQLCEDHDRLNRTITHMVGSCLRLA